MEFSLMNSINPLVSVIIPVYNGADYIVESITSILHQDYANIEVLVIDDGSSDATAEVVKNIIDSRVIYKYQHNKGSAVARNFGISIAKGDLIAFNDSDDLWAPHRLQQQVNFLLKNQDCQAVCGRFKSVDIRYSLEDAKLEQYEFEPIIDPKKSGWMYLKLLEISCFHIITLMVRRQALRAISFNPDYRRGQDFDFWLQLANKVKIKQLDNLYAFYRKNTNSISHKPHRRNYRAEILENAIMHYGVSDHEGREISTEKLKKIFSQVWFEHGYELFSAKWYKAATQSYLKGLNYRKNKLSVYKFLILSYFFRFKDKTPTHANSR
jgi:glycosyltransferase involved in cell wall biosynthesis